MCERQEVIGASIFLLFARPFQIRYSLVPFFGIEKGNAHIQHIFRFFYDEGEPGLSGLDKLSSIKQAMAQESPVWIIGGHTSQFGL